MIQLFEVGLSNFRVSKLFYISIFLLSTTAGYEKTAMAPPIR